MVCCSIIIGGLTDGSPLQNIGARAAGLMYTICRSGAQTRQTGFTTTECPVSGIGFQSLTVAAIRGPRVNLWIFAWQNLDRTFSGDISKKMACSKFWPHVIWGAPFQLGALRTCVPCLMVNPALCVSEPVTFHINHIRCRSLTKWLLSTQKNGENLRYDTIIW